MKTKLSIIRHSMLNVEIVLIHSDSKVTTYSNIYRSCAHCLITRAYCLLNMCKVLESSQQVCDEKEVMKVVYTAVKKEAMWTK